MAVNNVQATTVMPAAIGSIMHRHSWGNTAVGDQHIMEQHVCF